MILSKSLPLPEAVFSSWKGDSCVTDLWHMIYILSGSFTSFFSAVGYKHFQFLLNSISLFIENKFKREKAARSPEQRLRKHEYIWSHQLTLSPSLKQIGCYCFPYKEFIGGQPLTAKMEPELSLFILLHNMSVSLSDSVMPSNHLILSRPFLLLPPIFPSIRVFSNELALCIRWPKYWSFRQIILKNIFLKQREYSGWSPIN